MKEYQNPILAFFCEHPVVERTKYPVESNSEKQIASSK